MNAQQLEFDLFTDQTIECRLDMVSRQVNELSDSCGKVRRKLFGEVGSLKKICKMLIQENMVMRKAIAEMGGAVGEWSYCSDEELFTYVTKVLE
jgi:hypothetical protein